MSTKISLECTANEATFSMNNQIAAITSQTQKAISMSLAALSICISERKPFINQNLLLALLKVLTMNITPCIVCSEDLSILDVCEVVSKIKNAAATNILLHLFLIKHNRMLSSQSLEGLF